MKYLEIMKPLVDKMGIKVLYKLPTKNEVHYIIEPFDRRKWSEEHNQVIGEIKSNNPITLLYYHDLSSKS